MPDTFYSYGKRLDRALRWGWSYNWPNRGTWQASLVVKHGYKYAREQIRVFSSDLDEQVYCGELKFEYLEKFFAQQASQLKIIVTEKLAPTHEIWPLVAKHPDQVSIKLLEPGTVRIPSADFMVIDDFGIRKERDRKERSALVCFNVTDAQDLIHSCTSHFDKLAVASSPHPVP